MCTFKLAAVSNRELYQSFHGSRDMEDYTEFLARLAVFGVRQAEQESPNLVKPDILIVREKNLTESEYVKLFTSLWEKSMRYSKGNSQALIIPHTYPAAAEHTGSSHIHLPLPLLRQYRGKLQTGASVHSPGEAREAEALGASYVTAGHIFATDCKKGVLPRGIEFLEQVCGSVDIPVYVIGGIHPENLSQIRHTRAAGACMMSEFMRSRAEGFQSQASEEK